MQPVRALQSTGKSKACFTWHYAFVKNSFIKLDKTYGCLDDLDIDTDSISPEEVAATNTTINKYIYVDNSVNIGDKNKLEGSGILGGGKGHG